MYTSCSDLPMRLFIDVYNSDTETIDLAGEAVEINDLRFILKEYDEKASVADLIPVFDKIMQEYYELSGKVSEMDFVKEGFHQWELFKITAIDFVITCLKSAFKEGVQDFIDDFNLKVKINRDTLIDEASISKLEVKKKSIQNRHKVKQANENKERKSKEKKKIIWEDMMVNIHSWVDIMPDYNCSVALYLSYQKLVDKRVSLIKNKNGRT